MVLVNGRKMNFNHLTVSGQNTAMNIDSIPMDNIARIEVVKGPNSSLYGEKAIAGVVNIITKVPEEGLHTRVIAEYGTFIRIYQNKEKTDAPFRTLTDPSEYNHNLTYSALEGQKVYKLTDKNTLITGINLTHEKIKENNAFLDPDGVFRNYPLEKSQTGQSIYLEDSQQWGRGWSMNLGARYEHYNTFGGDVTGHIGLNKRLSDDTHAYFSFGTAVNNPTLKMRYANTSSWIGNPGLEQEKSHTFTLGVDSKINDKLTTSASLFSSYLKNALQWQSNLLADGTYGPGRYINVAREKRNGINVSATYKINNDWSVRGAYTYTNIKQKISDSASYQSYTGNQFPQQYDLTVMYKHGKWSADTMLSFVKGRSYNSFATVSYATLDINVNYQINKETKVYAKGYNLLDRSYQVEERVWDGLKIMPGRYFVAGVEHRF